MANEVADRFQREVGIDEPLHEGVAQRVRAWPRNLDPQPAVDSVWRRWRPRRIRWGAAAPPTGRTRADPSSSADHAADNRQWPHRRTSTAGKRSSALPYALVSPAAHVSSRYR